MMNLVLHPFDLSGAQNGPGARVSTINEQGEHIAYNDTRVITYQGFVAGEKNSFAAFTFADEWVNGLVMSNGTEYWLEPRADIDPANATDDSCDHASYKSEYTPYIDSMCHSNCNVLYGSGSWPSSHHLKATVTCTWVDQSFVNMWGGMTWVDKVSAIWNAVSSIYTYEVGVFFYVPCKSYYDYTSGASGCSQAFSNFVTNRPRDWNGGDRILAQFVGRALTSCGGIAHENYTDVTPPTSGQHMIAVIRDADSVMRQVRFTAHEAGHLHSAQHCDGYWWWDQSGWTYRHALMGAGCSGGQEVTCPSPCTDSSEFGSTVRSKTRQASVDAWLWPH